MNKEETRLQEQEAPAKNTDNAFVQVGANGEPQLPGEHQRADKQQDELVPQQEPIK